MSKAASVESTIAIDEEFARLIPPLHQDELRELELNLIESCGPRDPLVVWPDGGRLILLDGHNRHAICKRRGLPFAIAEVELPDRLTAMRWIERNQLGRRNLPRDSFSIILGRLYNTQKLKKGGQTKQTKGRGKTRERLGREYGLDERTVEKAGKFQAAAVKLGVESEIASGKLHVPQYRLIDAAKTLSANPTREECDRAIRKAMDAPAKKCGRDSPKEKSFPAPRDAGECLRAIRFYARTFSEHWPDSVEALANTLQDLTAKLGQSPKP